MSKRANPKLLKERSLVPRSKVCSSNTNGTKLPILIKYPVRFKQIPGTGGMYIINNYGHVYAERARKFLNYGFCNGYPMVGITLPSGKYVRRPVHILVAQVFVKNSNPTVLKIVNHLDGDRNNPCSWNLEWSTQSENIKHANNVLGKKTHKEVLQYSLEGQLIKKWFSLTEAAHHFGCLPQNIGNACRGRANTAMGYVWKYAVPKQFEDPPTPENGKPCAFNSDYIITSSGKVYNARFRKYLKLHLSQDGYLKIVLRNNKLEKAFAVHRLVAQTWIPNPEGFEMVNHIDHNKQNNDISNLQWCSKSENTRQYYKHIGVEAVAEKFHKRVLQYDADGKFVAIYPSVKVAAAAVGYSCSHIKKIAGCLKQTGFMGKAGDFYWTY